MYSCKKLKIRRSQNKLNHDNPELVKMRELIIDNIYPGFKTVTLFKTMHNGHREPVIGLETALKIGKWLGRPVNIKEANKQAGIMTGRTELLL